MSSGKHESSVSVEWWSSWSQSSDEVVRELESVELGGSQSRVESTSLHPEFFFQRKKNHFSKSTIC